MNTLKERIAAAQALAVQRTRETEPEVSWFVAAAQVSYNKRTGEPTTIGVGTHFRAWYHYVDPGTFGDPDVEEITERLIAWVRNAMELEMLVAEDPPMAPGADPKARLIDLMHARLAELRGTNGPPPA